MWGRTPRQVQGSPSSQNPNTQATHAGPAATPRPTHGLCARWGTDPGRPGPPGPEAPQPRRLAAPGPALQPGAGPRPSRPGHRPAGAGQSRGRPTRVIPQSCGQGSPRPRSPGQRRISGALGGHGAGASPTQRATKGKPAPEASREGRGPVVSTASDRRQGDASTESLPGKSRPVTGSQLSRPAGQDCRARAAII